MRATLIAGLLVVSASVSGYAEEPSRFHVSGAAGLVGGRSEAVHLAAGSGYSLNRHFSVGADLGYSYLPSRYGPGDRVYWGLATLTATAAPSAKVSPYLVLGYGLGRYVDDRGRADSGKVAASLGPGLSVRLRPRLSLFVETRLAVMGTNFASQDAPYAELPVRIGVRFGL